MNEEYSEILPFSEWDFDNITEQSQINAAFFYEYSRESMGIKKLVEEWRKLKSDPCFLFEKESPRVTKIQKLPFYQGIQFLSLFPDYFPAVPIQDIEDSGEDSFFIALKELFYPAPRIHLVDGRNQTELDFSLKNGSYIPPCGNKIFLDPDNLNLIVSIPRNLHGSAIKEGITKRILEDYSHELKPVLHANTLGMSGLPLGFDKKSALEWLSVLRRFKACGFTYKRYFGEYGFGKNVDSSESQLREKKRKASEIVKWFDSGGLGKIVSKDKGRSIVWDGEGITK